MKPFSESCEQNRQPILQVLHAELSTHTRLLEIGSGTGQHAVYFAPEFPALTWQTSDVVACHPGIHAWIEAGEADNILPPFTLDVCRDSWPATVFDVVFSANTVHIMAWPEVECLFEGVGKILDAGGLFILYGPFKYHGQFTSESNAHFEQWLKARDPASGIKDFKALQQLAGNAGLTIKHDYTMPANNQTLVWSTSG